MGRSDYIHSLEKFQNRVDCIVIEDLNMGSVSVTNDIENVVAEIYKSHDIDLSNYLIVYKDSSGQWDVYDPIKDNFIGLGTFKWYDAIELWLERKNK